MNEKFSRRLGYKQQEKEITIREDAPYDLRGVIINIAYESELRPGSLRGIICKVLRKRPNQSNWSEFPNIDGEVHDLIDKCEWYHVYDIIEAIYATLSNRGGEQEAFETKINDYFKQEGIGWQLVNGLIDYRGPEEFESTVSETEQVLADSGRAVSASEIKEAITDLSKRPTPDITGAIQHGLAALECVARDITGEPKATLGKILNDNPELFPAPLNKAIEKLWGYASEMGRHLREGKVPSLNEAEFLVTIASAACRYLVKEIE
jgi:hypothetical protein